MQKWKSLFHFARHMGPVYGTFRIAYEIARKSGIFWLLFPGNRKQYNFVGPAIAYGKFFFNHNPPDIPLEIAALIRPDTPVFPPKGSWLTNPETGYTYDHAKHWSQVSDFSATAGDIKTVWEPSRFTFLYDAVRHEHFGEGAHARSVFDSITDWIDSNPINCGPNWKCSQEISIRIFSWTFALQYYKNSPVLDQGTQNRILNSIYRQAQHIAKNILFSRIAVRNNHSLAETFCLYLVGTIYPFFPESRKWRENGKKWFEKEVAFQIDTDGAFIQHSMNYHRVAAQLLTWAIQLASLNDDCWSDSLLQRARATLNFLLTFQEPVGGKLPNYGNNDGALFFRLSSAEFRDYRPQLGALAAALNEKHDYETGPWQEESYWICGFSPLLKENIPTELRLNSFPKSGYYMGANAETRLFIRCAGYKYRPGQADNLHLDLWESGENLLFDAGNFRYNCSDYLITYYMGTEGHNTVAVGNYDQMWKGPRFIWTHWIRKAYARWSVQSETVVFEGSFIGYEHLVQGGITHRRIIETDPELRNFTVTDTLTRKPATLPMRQLWHTSHSFFEKFTLLAQDENGSYLEPKTLEGWYSDTYGVRKDITYWEFSTMAQFIKTAITRKS